MTLIKYSPPWGNGKHFKYGLNDNGKIIYRFEPNGFVQFSTNSSNYKVRSENQFQEEFSIDDTGKCFATCL